MKNLFLYLLCSFTLACQAQNPTKETTKTTATGDKVVKTKVEWQKCLTPEQYRVLREKGTEQAFTGKYYDHHEKGTYTCVACGNHLFTSDTKFDSGTGWPSYFQPLSTKAVKTKSDQTYGMDRVEVLCGRCDGHLGHVFEDGPKPTGLRYCINSASLNFVKSDKTATNPKENTKPKNKM